MDNVSIHRTTASRREILRPEEFILDGVNLEIIEAPAAGTSNVIVFAPSLLFGAVGSLADAAATSEANALLYKNQAEAAKDDAEALYGDLAAVNQAVIDAQAAAVVATAGAARLNGTSTTSNTVGTGSKSFTTETGKDFAAGRHILITSNANPDTQRMSGIVTSYNSGTGSLIVDVQSIIGSATRTDWTIRIDGERGAEGAASGTTLTINTQTASYQLALSDAGRLVSMNVAGANNLTVPTNATVAFPIGTQILVEQMGAGQTTVVAAGGVTINKHAYFSLKAKGQWAMLMLVKKATDTWTLTGHMELA